MLRAGDLRATIVDNQAHQPVHRAGYNGIAELLHTAQDSTPFVPLYAGFNLEHIFGGDSLAELFEPRRHPMTVFSDGDAAILYQPTTPLSGAESRLVFRLVPPHYVDVVFQVRLSDTSFFRHGYAGFFFASYIQAPRDKRITFRGRDKGQAEVRWIEAASSAHGSESTHVAHAGDRPLFFAPNFNATLANHFSGFEYEEPFYFGRFHDMALAFFFDSSEIIRFSQSPTGGGEANPAWDFQYLIPDPVPGRTYSFRARLVYKPYQSAEDIGEEYLTWKAKLDRAR